MKIDILKYFSLREISNKFYPIVFISLILFISCTSSGGKTTQQKKAKKIEYNTNLEALQNFDFKYFENSNLDYFDLELHNALKLIKILDFEDAEIRLRRLAESVSDSAKKFVVNKILVDLLFYKNDWKGIKNLDSLKGVEFKDDNPLVLVEAFSELEPEIINFISDSIIIKFDKSHSGTPVIEVIINGMKRNFWFDTGANYTVIASDIARESNVKPIKLKTSKALTGTTFKINVLPASIKQFKIGNLEIVNHPCIIADETDLRLRLFGSNRITKVDGIIGWKAIQKLDITFDDNLGIAIIRKPGLDSNVQRNLFWLGIPFLTILSEDNIALLFGLDTGSDKSTITSNIFKKVDYEDIYMLTKKISSAGGWTFNKSENISRLKVNIDQKEIEFTDIGTAFQHQKLFIQLDGILGSDIFRKNRVRIDILNGRFSIENE